MIRLAMLGLHLAMQASGSPPPPTPRTVVRDSTGHGPVNWRTPIRRPVTDALRASAFHDAEARDLFTRARAARLTQDSSLQNYDAKVRQRLSVKAAVGSVALEKLAYRQESAARVRWQRGVGVRIDVTGGRIAIPPLGMPAVERKLLQDAVTDKDLIPVPYFPGYEPLWVGGMFSASREVNEQGVVNPLADGAEAYYTYRSGDVITMQMGRDTISVRQIDVRPRVDGVNLIVGSLWLDRASGQLVRAAYRLSAPGTATVSVSASDTSGGTASVVGQKILESLMPTMSAQISAVVVEYERFDGFWLPRSQTMRGFAKASFASVPVTIENDFQYESVNARTNLVIHIDTTARVDSVVGRLRRASQQQCDTASTRVVAVQKPDAKFLVEMRIPCDLEALTRSPDLPRSVFDEGEKVFGVTDADRVIGEALSMLDQSPLRIGALPRPQFHYGVSMTRYNRIEGFSTGLLATEQLGSGFDLTGIGRFGFADHDPRLELSLGRTNSSTTIRLGAYDRLVSASDWDDPLTFGSSLSAFFFGRDEAFYYRTKGGELLWTSDRGPRLSWRAFRERQRTAIPHAEFSVGGSFAPNIAASGEVLTGASMRWITSNGLDPRGFRLSTDLRLEGAKGDSAYGRGALELALSRGMGGRIDAGLTLGGGSSVGYVPRQREWFLGGTQTVRGQRPDTAQSGNAFWLGRFEIARPVAWLRPSLFGDIGWTGDRTQMANVGRPLSGVGIGFSALDGAIRLDVARGIYPRRQTRLSLYIGARF